MRAFTQALEDERQAIYVPWEDLRNRIRPVPGSLVVILGAPGSLKSMFSLTWAYQLDKPVTLISLDTDPLTQAARLVALHSGGRVLTSDVLESPTEWSEWLEDNPLPMLVVDQPVAPTDLAEILEAHSMYWGEVPAMLVVDDIASLAMKSRDYEGFDSTILELRRVARRYQTTVVALHHVHRGDSAARSHKLKMSDGKYSGEYVAETILGLWRPKPQEPELRVSILKNRFGQDDPNGDLYARLYADPARCQIRDVDYFEGMRFNGGK